MAGEIKAMTIDGTRRTIKDETARNAAATAQRTANGKQDALVFDTAPTSGSNNPVTSGGIYDAMQSFAPELPIATDETLGAVMVDGETITVDEDGVISGASTYTLPTASASQLGGVKVDGDTITIDGNGVISGASTYELPMASTSQLGGVKVDGETISIDANGVISGASDAPTPDWNESDPNAGGYIANRPFYHEYETNELLSPTEYGGIKAAYGMTLDYVNYALVAENVVLQNGIEAETVYAITVDGKTYTRQSSDSAQTFTLTGTDSTTKTITGISIKLFNQYDDNDNVIIIRTATDAASILIKGVASTEFVTPTKVIGFGEYIGESTQTIPLMYIPIDWTYITTDESNNITLDIQAIKDAIDALGGE